jgi:hypothetical protein
VLQPAIEMLDSFGYALRRRTNPMPLNAIPGSAKLAGSGTDTETASKLMKPGSSRKLNASVSLTLVASAENLKV